MRNNYCLDNQRHSSPQNNLNYSHSHQRRILQDTLMYSESSIERL